MIAHMGSKEQAWMKATKENKFLHSKVSFGGHQVWRLYEDF